MSSPLNGAESSQMAAAKAAPRRSHRAVAGAGVALVALSAFGIPTAANAGTIHEDYVASSDTRQSDAGYVMGIPNGSQTGQHLISFDDTCKLDYGTWIPTPMVVNDGSVKAIFPGQTADYRTVVDLDIPAIQTILDSNGVEQPMGVGPLNHIGTSIGAGVLKEYDGPIDELKGQLYAADAFVNEAATFQAYKAAPGSDGTQVGEAIAAENFNDLSANWSGVQAELNLDWIKENVRSIYNPDNEALAVAIDYQIPLMDTEGLAENGIVTGDRIEESKKTQQKAYVYYKSKGPDGSDCAFGKGSVGIYGTSVEAEQSLPSYVVAGIDGATWLATGADEQGIYAGGKAVFSAKIDGTLGGDQAVTPAHAVSQYTTSNHYNTEVITVDADSFKVIGADGTDGTDLFELVVDTATGKATVQAKLVDGEVPAAVFTQDWTASYGVAIAEDAQLGEQTVVVEDSAIGDTTAASEDLVFEIGEKPGIPLIPLEPAEPTEPGDGEEDDNSTPLIPLEPAEPTEPGGDTDGENTDDGDNVPLTPIEPAEPVTPETEDGKGPIEDGPKKGAVTGLAETGSNGALLTAGIASLLAAAGGALTFLSRRKRAGAGDNL